MPTYFFHDGHQQRGPFSVEDLKQQGLKANMPVWTEGMENWRPASQVEELKALFDATPPLISHL